MSLPKDCFIPSVDNKAPVNVGGIPTLPSVFSPPAFPFRAWSGGEKGGQEPEVIYSGMTLRDYFAGKAVDGAMVRLQKEYADEGHDESLPDYMTVMPTKDGGSVKAGPGGDAWAVACYAYDIADAMLLVRCIPGLKSKKDKGVS